MEDAATAEIARTQIWQWIKYPKGVLDDGRKITADLFRQLLKDDISALHIEHGEAYARHRFDEAATLLDHMTTAECLAPFLTSEAYPLLP